MKLYKTLFIFIFITFLSHNGYNQAVISFNEANFDFGKVAEGTQATHEFKFKNTGNSPLVIDKVQASCGCTTPFWTKEPVLPGKEGVITASYNSSNRPGAFNKSITITSNATPSTLKITIKGTVVPVKQAEVVYSKEALENSPVLTFEKELINLGKVELGQPVLFTANITNKGKTNLIISDLASDCNCIQMTSGATSVIYPGKTETLEFVYRAKDKGKITEQAIVLSNDLRKPKMTVKIQAEVVESLTNNSILRENKPGFTF